MAPPGHHSLLHRLSRDWSQVPTHAERDSSVADDHGTLTLRPYCSSPALPRAFSQTQSRESVNSSLYSGKQSPYPHCPMPRSKPLRPIIHFPSGFEFVDNSYTPSASALSLRGSGSPNQSAETLVVRASSLSGMPTPDEPTPSPSTAPADSIASRASPEEEQSQYQEKLHPASVPSNVARPLTPALLSPVAGDVLERVPEVVPSTSRLNLVDEPTSAPSLSYFDRPVRETERPEIHGRFGRLLGPLSPPLALFYHGNPSPPASLAPSRKIHPADAQPFHGDTDSSYTPSIRSRNASPCRSGPPSICDSPGRNRDRTGSASDCPLQIRPTASRRASQLILSRTTQPPSSPLVTSPVLPSTMGMSSSWHPAVGFDTMPDGLETASETISFTLQCRSKGYRRSKNTRLFMCGTDGRAHSDVALTWLMDQLVEDGDEVIAVRAIEGEKDEVDQELIRRDAHDLLHQIAGLNDDVPGRKISVVVEFMHGHPTLTVLRMITAYRPHMLIVGTRGRTAHPWQRLLGSATMIGHVSRDTLQRSPVPVVVVRPEMLSQRPHRRWEAGPERASRRLSGVSGSDSKVGDVRPDVVRESPAQARAAPEAGEAVRA